MKSKIVTFFILCNIASAEFIKLDYKDVMLNNRKNIINKKIEEIKNLKEDKEKLKKINTFFNKYISYSSDIKLYKKNNHIASFEETLMTMKGDCDDYVLAKIQALDYIGIKNSKLLFSTENGVRHVKILTPLKNKNIYVLDSLDKKFRIAKKSDIKGEDKKVTTSNTYLFVANHNLKKLKNKIKAKEFQFYLSSSSWRSKNFLKTYKNYFKTL